VPSCLAVYFTWPQVALTHHVCHWRLYAVKHNPVKFASVLLAQGGNDFNFLIGWQSSDPSLCHHALIVDQQNRRRAAYAKCAKRGLPDIFEPTVSPIGFARAARILVKLE